MNDPLLLEQYKKKEGLYFGHTRPEMQALIPAGTKRLLDVGCGAGGFAAELAERRNLEAWGVELNPEAAATAAGRLHKVYSRPFDETLDLPEGYFDVVTFNDVLEHLPDPGAALRHARTVLKPGGVVVASIPNFRHFDNLWKLVVKKEARYEKEGIMDRTHLRLFTESSIPLLFEEAGMKVKQIHGINGQYVNRKFYFFRLLTLGMISDMQWLQFAVVAG